MSAPKRIQLRRTKGWRLPAGAVVVARPSRWGNPFQVRPARSSRGGPLDMWGVWWAGRLLGRWDDRSAAAADAVDRFRRAVTDGLAASTNAAAIRAELAGHDLACWCPLEDADGNRVPCHADVLLEIANSEDAP